VNYDAVGNVVSITDPRGNDSQIVYNELDQVARTVSREVSDGSGVRYERDYHYDANNNLVRRDVQNIDGDGVLEANSHFTTTYEYDVLNKLVRRVEEVDASNEIVTEFEYDGNRNLTLVRKGAATNGSQPGNTVGYAYDERDLLFTETRAPGDAAQSTTQFDYDANRNRVQVLQGLEGSPRVTVHVYDAYNRTVGAVDPMGNEAVMTYDANLLVIEPTSQPVERPRDCKS